MIVLPAMFYQSMVVFVAARFSLIGRVFLKGRSVFQQPKAGLYPGLYIQTWFLIAVFNACLSRVADPAGGTSDCRLSAL